MIPIPNRTVGRALLTVVLALAVGGCGLSEELDRERNPDRAVPEVSPSELEVWPTEAPSADPSTEAPAACPSSGVRMLPGLVEAAMGLRAMSVTLTNCGAKPYALNGYPSIEVLDESREPVDGVRVLRGAQDITTGVPDLGPHSVTLASGESARTSLVWRNTVTEVDVPAVNAPYLRIAPAKGEAPEVLTPDGGIDLGNTGRLGTTAWAKVSEDG
ncbi:DUF4232 domain-containing protein [Streptomyces adelaidensis]|uniref:DUF4232 domain-containing protein n=1 Tax=Streptomyces adelaidensis TaxID=2796465 RepID=UPI001905D267|nr:DUF4232 domain-containing protein [Streptomyces adelaidensis]